MLKKTFQNRVKQAMLEKDEVSRDIFRLLLGEIERVEQGGLQPISDEQILKVVAKMVKDNTETRNGYVKIYGDGESYMQTAIQRIDQENALLSEFLPRCLTKEEIIPFVENMKDAVIAANSEQSALGIVMKFCKAQKLVVDSVVVRTIIVEMRGTGEVV